MSVGGEMDGKMDEGPETTTEHPNNDGGPEQRRGKKKDISVIILINVGMWVETFSYRPPCFDKSRHPQDRYLSRHTRRALPPR